MWYSMQNVSKREMSNPVFYVSENKKKKNNTILSSAKLAQRMVKVNGLLYTDPKKEKKKYHEIQIVHTFKKKVTICTDTSFTIMHAYIKSSDCLLMILKAESCKMFSNIFEFTTNPIFWEIYYCFKATFLFWGLYSSSSISWQRPSKHIT